MVKLYFHLLLLIYLTFINFYASSQNLNAEIITISSVDSDDFISIIVRVRNDDQSINTSVYGEYLISASGAILENNQIKIKRGVGSITTKVFASDSFIISLDGLIGQKMVLVQNNIPLSQQSGEISSDMTWTSDSIYHVSGDLTILPQAALTIEEGTKVYLEENVNLIVNGKILITGSKEKPVIFQPFDPVKAWGGVMINNSTDMSSVESGFFIYGGNNPDYIFGHSNSQPVLFADNTNLNISNSYFLDNPGKAVGGVTSVINISNCILSRCDTGGEYHDCKVTIQGTYYLDMPNDDGIPVDDDNDASYFYGIHPSFPGQSVVDNCVFITGKDDGIDHNGAYLEVGNCWIEGFYHEGIAASNTNEILVYNTLVKDCEQGIEAGYGNPHVIINHCVMVNNDVGLRFGDSYDWGCDGLITATNSILYGNNDNIWNYDLLTRIQFQVL